MDKRIKDLQEATTVALNYLVAVDQEGLAESKRISLDQLKIFLGLIATSGIEGVVTSTSFDPPEPPAGSTVIYFAKPGTYPNFTGLEPLTDPLNLISWDGTTAVGLGIDIGVDLSDYPTKEDLDGTITDAIKDQSPLNINDNYRWLRGLTVTDSAGTDAPDWAYVGQYGATSVPWGSTLPILEMSQFGYLGQSVTFPFVGTGSMAIYVPNSSGFIVNGNSFKAIVEIKSDAAITLSVAVRRNASLVAVSEVKTVTLAAGVAQTLEFDCIASDNSTRYMFHIQRNSGSTTVNLKIGRVFLGFGGVSLDGENQTALDYLRRKGLTFDLDAKNKVLKNISIGSDSDAVPLSEVKRLANLPVAENLLLINKQETEIWVQNIPEPGDGYTMTYNHINPAVTTVLASAQDTLDVTKENAGDQVPVFDYRGNCLVFDVSGIANSNFQAYVQFKLNQLAKLPKTNMLYMRFEIASQNPITIPSVKGYRTSTTVIDTDGSTNNNTAISNVPKVVTLSLNTDLITQTPKNDQWIGLRLFFGATQPVPAGKVYIGRIVVSEDPNCNIDTVSVNSLRLKENVKIGFWGDSIVRQMRIDPKGVRRIGAYFSTTEIAVGRGGHQPTAIGGTRIMPYSDFTPGQSIYERISEAVTHYRGDIDVLRGGANDPRSEYISSNLWTPDLILGKATDPTYNGTVFPTQSEYLSYWNGIKEGASRNPSDVSDFTFASVYRGCLQNLINARPNGKVFSMTVFIPSGGSSYQTNVWNPMWDLIIQISASLGVKCIDARSEAGINLLNADLYYSQVDRVHPNNEAGKMIANTEVRYLGEVDKTI